MEIVARLQRRYQARDGSGLHVDHGDATGVDSVVGEACDSLGVPHDRHEARWGILDAPGARIAYRRDGSAFNAAAGPDRNRRMVELKPDFCIAMHKNLGRSRGTKDCVRQCLDAEIPVYWIASDAIPIVVVQVKAIEGNEVLT